MDKQLFQELTERAILGFVVSDVLETEKGADACMKLLVMYEGPNENAVVEMLLKKHKEAFLELENDIAFCENRLLAGV